MENAFGILASRIQGPTGHHETKAKGCQRYYTPLFVRDNVLTFIAQYTENTLGRLDRVPNSADDIAVIAYEVTVYVPNENHRNPSREAKHQ